MMDNFVAKVPAVVTSLGLAATTDDAVIAGAAAFKTDLAAAVAALAASAAATATKTGSRGTLESAFSVLYALLVANGMTDDDRESLGLRVLDTIPTPVGAPTSQPILVVDTSQRLRLTVNFADVATPTSRAKPPGVRSCRLWIKIGGPAPGDLSECTFLADDTRTPYTAIFDGEDGGQIAHVIGQWVSTRGDVGPISETVSSTIGA
jgi:hypothetical protein